MNYLDRKSALLDLEKAEQLVLARQYQNTLIILIRILYFLVRRVRTL